MESKEDTDDMKLFEEVRRKGPIQLFKQSYYGTS